MKIDRNLRYALVLSGGGAKGLAHLGFLRALLERGWPEPSLVVGTSMGAIIGGLYASGTGLGELHRYVLEEFDITKHLDGFTFKLAEPVARVFQAGKLLGNLAAKPGIDSGEHIEALIDRFLGVKTFEETRIPFRCNAVDLVSGQEVVFRSGPLGRAIHASMSIPMIFAPVTETGPNGRAMCLVDGGLADNLPVHIAEAEGFSRILAVDVGGFRDQDPGDFVSVPKIAYRCLEYVMFSRARRQDAWEGATVINAAGGTAGGAAGGKAATLLSFDRKRELVALGEQSVAANQGTLETFFGKGYEAAAARRRARKRRRQTRAR
ncbi:MAG: patatin-like phospholipase family protein [Treponema sp.]|nr:patatin-like phospholipase family protein [Treponema sp.]